MAEGALMMDVQEEEQLDISIQRVEKINKPLLVIGLGGTGAGVVHTIKRTFAKRFILPKDKDGKVIPVPRRTAYLVLDTDVSTQGDLAVTEFKDLTVKGISHILAPEARDAALTAWENKWINKTLSGHSQGAGAGGNRQLGRLLLFRNYDDVKNRIHGLVEALCAVDPNDAAAGSSEVEVVICAGISGGTGSGTFLDVPQIVRNIIRSMGKSCRIKGFIIMPDVSVKPVIGSPSENSIYVNGYAALKELDFWMNIAEHETPYDVQYSAADTIRWDKPFDSCALISDTNVKGVVFKNPTEAYRATIAENLLHYMADEAPSANTDGMAEFTYRQYEDNMGKTIGSMIKVYPLTYGFQAIGGYTKRIPKRKVMFYEGSLLFNTFVPPRNDHGQLVPDDSLLKDGQTLNRAKEIVTEAGKLYNEFKQVALLPAICGVAANDKVRIEQMKRMSIKPHDQVDVKPSQWLSSSIRPAAAKAAEAYLKAAWDRFQKLCLTVMQDPAKGPFALQLYLTDPTDKGFIPQMKQAASNWDTTARTFRGGIGNAYEACKNAWPTFENPPFLGGQKAIEAYMQALNSCFDASRKAVFMDEHAKALNKLVLRMEEYVRDALKPLCKDLEKLHAKFAEQDLGDVKLGSDIVDVNVLKPRIDTLFEDGNANNKVSMAFLGEICALAAQNQPDVNTFTSGVVFTYNIDGRDMVLEKMREILADNFGSVNEASLDDLIVQVAGDDVAAQQKEMQDLRSTVVTNADAMYQMNPAYASTFSKFTYLSMPDNAPVCKQFYLNHPIGKTETFKDSSLRDQVYCTNTLDGLTLGSYGPLNNLETRYSDGMLHSADVLGLAAHLVNVGSDTHTFATDWSTLPDPAPYYLFRTHGAPLMENEYARVKSIVERAIDCRMVTVDDSTQSPVFTVKLFYANKQTKAVFPSEWIKDEMDEILNTKVDPKTGMPTGPQWQMTEFANLMDRADDVVIKAGRSPACMAAYLGLVGEPCDPWDASIASDRKAVQKAKDNYKALCRALATAILSRRPLLIEALAAEVEGFEYMNQVEDRIGGEVRVWQRRAAYAPTFADLYIFGVVHVAGNLFKFTDDAGNEMSVIQDHFLADDLKNATLLVKNASYLGDRPEADMVRQNLEFRVNPLKSAAMAGMLEPAAGDAAKAAGDKLKAVANKEMAQKKAALLSFGANQDLLNKEISVLAAILKEIEDVQTALTPFDL